MKLKKKVKVLLFIIIIAIVGIFFITKRVNYINSYNYKLLEIGYSNKEIDTLLKTLNNNQLEEILLKEYNSSIVKVILEKYFIYNNLDRYLDYINNNDEVSISDTITLVNVNRDYDYYTNIKKTNIDDTYLMLVNKYYYLEESYTPKDIITTSGVYAYANNSLNKDAYEAFKILNQDAKKEGYTILINSSYRDYKTQDELWKKREDYYGEENADKYAARAGHSEHQSAYAIDVSDFYDVNDTFGDTEAFKWMRDNSYKYGFILRYPENKENITGYSYEPWHYRYVGVDIAKIIYEEDITFDEYYAYYIENK